VVIAVGEDKDVSRAGEAGFDPGALMLEEQFFIASVSSVIGLGVAPAVQEVTAVAVLSSVMACCLIGGCTVVDDPDLVEVMGAEEDLVIHRVVVHRVHMDPVPREVFAEIDVDEFRVFADDTVVIL